MTAVGRAGRRSSRSRSTRHSPPASASASTTSRWATNISPRSATPSGFGCSSLALNMAFKPLNAFAVMTRLLEGLLENREIWREGPPPTYPSTPAVDAVPEEVGRYLSERIDEVCAHLGMLDVDDELVRDIWRS